jgi:glycerate dehydrogenase
MHIVVLDGFTLNPGDLTWAGLEALGPTTIHERTPPEQTIARAADREIVLTNKTILSREIIERLPRLRYIGLLSTGFNVVDLDAAGKQNVPVTNVPAYATPSVVQMVFAHLLNLTLHVADHSHGVRAGRWTQSKDFCYWNFPLIELAGLTMGIVGFGQIGRAVATVARAFGMNVLAHKVSPPSDLPEGVRFVDLDDLFRQSDVVSLHCPLNPVTQHLVNADRLAMMKRSAILINTGRGPLIDETALAEALNAGRIAGAGLDVLSTEPPSTGNPLLNAQNCCLTPHIAWATRAARQRLLDVVIINVQAFLAGKPQNVVNVVSRIS